MKEYLLYIIFCFACINNTFAQENFRTIVPQHPVVVGESFQVQFVIGSDHPITNIIPPSFRGFNFVSGPNSYSGSVVEDGQLKKYQNLVFTVKAIKKGRFRIRGAVVFINGAAFRSNDEMVEVISKSDASLLLQPNNQGSEYFLHPGEDPMEKIQRNLFLKVLVNRNSCYIGEPVVATFKLYSRLQSRSEILKNPGFYGFGVYDIVSLNDRVQTMEIVNGNAFDVHTVRKVQLFPFQSGIYTIDPMEVHNEVEFSRSSVNKRPEQEITEGINNGIPNEKKEGIEIFETNLKTAPVLIKVKPLPGRNEPIDFNGAVGNFKIDGVIKNKTIVANEESVLEVTITGNGNFPHINAPAVQWPVNFETFEMHVTDSVNRHQVPLSGKRTFRYPFVVSKAQNYIIPPVRFSYFNPVLKKYLTLQTPPFPLDVRSSLNKNRVMPEIKFINASVKKSNWWLTDTIISFIILLVLFLASLAFYKKKNKISLPNSPVELSSLTIDDRLLPLRILLTQSDRVFYVQLKQSIWNYVAEQFHLIGNDLNRTVLIKKLAAAGIAQSMISDLTEMLDLCEMYIYNEIDSFHEAGVMLEKTRNILKTIGESSSE